MNEPGPMSTGGSQNRVPPSPLPDLRRRPGWSPYTGLQDPVVTGAARSSSDPTTTAAWYVTLRPTPPLPPKMFYGVSCTPTYPTSALHRVFYHSSGRCVCSFVRVCVLHVIYDYVRRTNVWIYKRQLLNTIYF